MRRLVALVVALAVLGSGSAWALPETIQDCVPAPMEGWSTELASARSDVLGMGLAMRWREYAFTDDSPNYAGVAWETSKGPVTAEAWAGVVFVEWYVDVPDGVESKGRWIRANGSTARVLYPVAPVTNLVYIQPNAESPATNFAGYPVGELKELSDRIVYRGVVYWSGRFNGTTHTGSYRVIERFDGMRDFGLSRVGSWSQASAPQFGVDFSDSGMLVRSMSAAGSFVTQELCTSATGRALVGGGYTVDAEGVAAVDSVIGTSTVPAWVGDGLNVDQWSAESTSPPGFELPDYLNGFQGWMDSQLERLTSGVSGLLWWLDIFEHEGA